MSIRWFVPWALIAVLAVGTTGIASAQESPEAQSEQAEAPNYEGVKFAYIMAAVRRDRAISERCQIGDLDARFTKAGKRLRKLIGKEKFKSLRKTISESNMDWKSNSGCFGNGPRLSFAKAVTDLENALEGFE